MHQNPFVGSSSFFASQPAFSLLFPSSLSLNQSSIHFSHLLLTMEVKVKVKLLAARISFLVLMFDLGQAFNGGENKIKLLNLHQFRWETKHTDDDPTCFSRKSSRRENGATILEMKHKDYCSGPIKDWNQRLQTRIIFDNYRVQSIQSRLKRGARVQDISQTQIPLTSGIKLQTLNYIVTIELGGKNMTLIVDTGSDLTWVQCQPCKMCYNQQGPIFDPSLSKSYQAVPCGSQPCRSLVFATGKYGLCGGSPQTSSCNYYVSYGDGSFTGGDLATEKIDLGATPVQDFVFGCGRNNKGLFGGASGLMGLGRSELSLVSQTNSIFGGVFSYCLPSSDSESSGSLTFGGDYSVFSNSTPISYTRMVENPQLSSFYFINLTGASVGGVNLQSPSFGTGGVLIDSGTVITRLPPSIYRSIKTEFLNQFSGIPSAPGFSILDVCFNLSGYREVNIPTLRMEFEGGSELEVDVMGMFYFVRSDASQVCLALASLTYEDQIPILGNFQQRNTRVVYDTVESRLGFARESCDYA
ncbi:aspartyl protease family protein At5g10770 [Impatiens glandulifera]|uniref:aspartyl protease family protein At5g10770 n=1 Tax=Impatiens glandulifera TaxID=253017 RepID=UPI001FB0919A|nr:aspartyl protease family protein At5g10770 [Impatiens glandulifera]